MHGQLTTVGQWPRRGTSAYVVYDEGGQWVARGLTAKQAYALASCATAHGQTRVVETPDGVRRTFEPQTAPTAEYTRYLQGGPDPRD